ncbi:MAG TPA: alpha/beta-hydrolase family protein [Blastococcus sp.]|nr:alpha/beta-hydrolase family protein [Blastococcus sp.]
MTGATDDGDAPPGSTGVVAADAPAAIPTARTPAETAAPEVAGPPPGAEAPVAPRHRWGAWLPHYPWSGTVGALLFGYSSFTPSLLPRGWLLQGVVAGVTAAIGYGLGCTVMWFVAQFTDRRPSPGFRRRSWQVLAVLAVVVGLVTLWAAQRWQAQIDQLMGLPAPVAYRWGGTVVVAVLMFAALVGIGRLVRRVTRWLIRVAGRVLPHRLVRPLAVVVTTALVVFLLNGVLFQGLVDAANSSFSVSDHGTEKGAVEPTEPERSGSPASLVPWDSLGLQGRNFVGRGPTVAQLSAFSGRPALEPVRAYAGLATAGDIAARAELAVRDLQRAGGFDRAVLVVATTTGTGWIDPAASDSLEYEFNGNTAIVGMQYSYLPSWLSFLVDQVKARDAGRALFDAVYGAWAELPAGHRPRLYVFGESLGTFGGEAAFSGLADIVNRTDGVLWVGPPNFNPLYRSIVEGRAPGSPEWLPVYQNGQTVRFANGAADLNGNLDAWKQPRVLYLQHASDPIVWWSPHLVLSRPDWLRGQRGPDVSPHMPWIPFVTFWQVTADMVFAVNVPPGHGHHYTADYVNGWAQVTQPPGWTAADTDRLRPLITGG